MLYTHWLKIYWKNIKIIDLKYDRGIMLYPHWMKIYWENNTIHSLANNFKINFNNQNI